jgi:hypothetical protein
MEESFADKAMKNLQDTANKLLNYSNDISSKENCSLNVLSHRERKTRFSVSKSKWLNYK